MKRLLLISNSRNYRKRYLEHAQDAIEDFLGPQVTRVLFVPFASANSDFDEYTGFVGEHFREMGYELNGIHLAADPQEAVRQAQAIAISGGNTFHLLGKLCELDLLDVVRRQVEGGLPYVGWSAGANVACPSLKTTNDMPIVEPPSFRALNLVPFQINPHYTDARLPKHQGESRAQRIEEFVAVNPGVYVVGLREGSMLRIEGDRIGLLGEPAARIFGGARSPAIMLPKSRLTFSWVERAVGLDPRLFHLSSRVPPHRGGRIPSL